MQDYHDENPMTLRARGSSKGNTAVLNALADSLTKKIEMRGLRDATDNSIGKRVF